MKHVLALCLLGASAAAAQAGTITATTDRAAFEAQFAGVTVEDFGPQAAFPIASGILNSATDETTANGVAIRPGDIVDGVTFSTPVGTGLFFNIDAGGGFTGGFLDGLGSANENLTIAFDVPQSAFGFSTNSGLMRTFDLAIGFAGGGTFTGSYRTPGAGALVFFGFTSDAKDISSVVIDGTSGFNFAIDDFTFPAVAPPATPIPLPAGLPLLLAGLGTLALMRRRR